MMLSTVILVPATLKDGLGNSNALMSLPTSLIHYILSDWVDALSLIRLDFAFCGDAVFHSQLLDDLKSDLFYVKKFERPNNLPTYGIPPSEHPYTHMLEWIVLRKVKVIHIEPHELCAHTVLEEFLQKYGEHVRHICFNDDNHRLDHFPTQNALIEKFCRNLTEYVVSGYNATDGCILRVLNNNPRLQKLHIDGSLDEGNDPISNHIATLHHLQELQWTNSYRFGDSLIAFVRVAPNLQKLSLIDVSTEIDGAIVVGLARACPNLRTLSCNELHFGPNDSSLRPFFAVCSGIVNLNLSVHYKLTDTVLIEALSELSSLQCLNLQGCSRLTDRTVQFLTQRFATTLQVLYLDHSVHQDVWENETVVISSAFTTESIERLRAQCTKLHTFHYSVEVNENLPPLPLDAYQSATVVYMRTGYEEFLPMILEHCQQMEILTMVCGTNVWLSVDELMAIAARCPQLHTVIIGKANSKKEKNVDYSAVRKSFPKLRFTKDESLVDFNVLGVPV